jgi:4-hydroxy-2-oxoheptanedioate aldolase
MVQIETREALDIVEEIARLVDVVFVGPFDLGNNIGRPILGQEMHPELSEAIERIRKAAKEAGSKSGIYCVSGEQARKFADKGFDMISVAMDYTVLAKGMEEAVAAARGES